MAFLLVRVVIDSSDLSDIGWGVRKPAKQEANGSLTCDFSFVPRRRITGLKTCKPYYHPLDPLNTPLHPS